MTYAVNNSTGLPRMQSHQHVLITLTVIIGILLTLFLVYLEQQNARNELYTQLVLRAQDETARIQRSMDIVRESLASIGSLYAASDFVDRHEFQQFVKNTLLNHPEIRALEWAPQIHVAQRDKFEKMLSENKNGQTITELNDAGKLIPARYRQIYFPVLYVEPFATNETSLGFDLNSQPVRSNALWNAISSGEQISSMGVQLVQTPGKATGILFFQPVYQKNSIVDSTLRRQKNIEGVAVAIVTPDELINTSLRAFRPTGLDLMLLEYSDVGDANMLYFHPSRSRTAPIAVPSVSEFRDSHHYQTAIKIPGGYWHALYRPAPAFIAEHQSIQHWIILFTGLFLTGLITLGMARRIRHMHEVLAMAQHDALTGLPNRLLLQDRIQQAIVHSDRTHSFTAVLFLDLDNFKHINDSLGHAVGDRLLRQVATRLRHTMRQEDTIARMGGDEFILLIQELPDAQGAASLAEKILQSLTSPYQIEKQIFYLSASIGISLYPRDGQTTEALIANADAAMYRAKAKGRNTFEFYASELTTTALQRVQIEVDLRQALKTQQLHIHYQPQVDMVSGAIIGAEALCRWTHPEHGAISPLRFIPVAEASGLIVELGDWVLQQACKQARLWMDEGRKLRSIAVNVASAQLQRHDFVSSVKNALIQSRLPPQMLELELTENIVMTQAEQSFDTLVELSQLGIRLTIDDFGTGHSSLAYLKQLPVDKLKIDRSFIQDLPADQDDGAITTAIIALSRSLELAVIAEGVETIEQCEFLYALGCKMAQGYYFGHPVAPELFPKESTRQFKIAKTNNIKKS